MRYGSLCSGIEAASVAFGPLGWEAAWFSEIEAFPNAVLAHHYPGVANHGDMTTIRERILSGEIEAPDMICGGPPCQAFSVAGLRRSLDDERGNLTLEYVKICDATDAVRLAAGRPPAWILYENVPGILNTKDNAFGALLGGLCGSDTPIVAPAGWGRSGVVNGPTRTVAYRVLNAEHFGLAQRRQRVFVLALGGAGRWAAADALLPIIESSRWHPAPSRSTGERPAPTISARTKGGGGLGTDAECDGALIEVLAIRNSGRDCDTREGRTGTTMQADMMFTLQAQQQHSMLVRMREGKEGGGKGPLVSEDQILATPINTQLGLRGAETSNTTREGIGIGKPGDPAFTLQANHCHAVATPILVRMREGKEGGGKGPLVSEDQSLTLATGNDQVLAYAIQERAVSENVNAGPQGKGWQEDVAFTMEARHHAQSVSSGMQVRRLTPRECERLQGFPDGYTNIPWRSKPESPDGPRYKALGNSWAVPCARWIGERIKAIRP